MESIDRTYNEKRDFIRMQVNSPLDIRHEGKDYQGICKDLSGAGMLIETDQLFEIGAHLEISIQQQGETHLPFHATAEVTRIEGESGEGHILGLSIKEIRD